MHRDDGVQDVELKKGATVGACRRKAAAVWGWHARSIVLRTPEGNLLQDDRFILKYEILIATSLQPHGVAVTFCTAASTVAPCTDADASVEVILEIPGVGKTNAFEVQIALARRIGMHHCAFILHQQTGGEELFAIADGPLDDELDGMNQPSDDEAEKGQPSEELAAPPPEDVAPARPTTPEKFEDDVNFDEVLRVRRACFEAKDAQLNATDSLQLAAENLKMVQDCTKRATKWMEKEKPLEAREVANEAKPFLEAVKAAAADADKEVMRAALKVPIAEKSLEAATEVIELKTAEFKAAKENAREVARTTQQARIARKKVAQAIQASKDADADRDAKQEDMLLRKRSEEAARPQVLATLAAAQATSELARRSNEILEAALASVARADEVATIAEEAAAARARAWLAEKVEFDKQGYSLPLPADALRDDEILQELDPLEPGGPIGCRRVLCRLRPRAARLFTEMHCCDQLFGVMGSSCDSSSPSTPWASGFARTHELLTRPSSNSNGDLVLRATGPFSWQAALRGPRGSPYAGFYHWVSMEFTADWPGLPPQLKFQTPIYHCNVAEDGLISYGPLALVRERWSQLDTVFPMLGTLMEMFCVPDAVVAVRPELSALLASDPKAYLEAAGGYAREHAISQDALLPNGPQLPFKQ